MKAQMIIAFLLVNLLAACAAPPLTQEATSPSRTIPPVTATRYLSTSTETAVMPSLTPTTTAAPKEFGFDTYSQFVQIQAYSAAIEAVLGKDMLSMRVDDAAYSSDGRYVAIGGCTENVTGNCQSKYFVSDSFLMILDSQTGEVIASIPETEVSISSLVFTSDGEKLVYAVNPVRIVIWDIARQEVERTLWKDEVTYLYPQVAISPDDSMIAAVYADTLLVWQTAGGDLLAQIPAAVSGGYLPQFSADGSRLAVFTRDDGNEIMVYDTGDWSRVSSFQPGGQTEIALFSPDGDWLVTAEWGSQAEVLIWDVESGAPAGALGASFDSIYTLAFSPDGGLLLVSSLPPEGKYYEGLGVWDFAARKPLGVIYNIMTPYGIQFSADGRSFLFDYSPFIYRWSLPEGDALAARQAVLDFLTALANGDYAAAAELFQPTEDDIAYFRSLGLDSSDGRSVLEFICGQAAEPCSMSLKEMLYEGKSDDGSYIFLLTFTAADGTQLLDASGDDILWVNVEKNASGGMRVLSLPSFMYGS